MPDKLAPLGFRSTLGRLYCADSKMAPQEAAGLVLNGADASPGTVSGLENENREAEFTQFMG
jgi:hypothetical protein